MTSSDPAPMPVPPFEIREVMSLLAHRHPFLLVDRVLAYEPQRSLTALKNVTYNEPFFPGHFPAVPTMPGVLMLEALAQACGLLAILDSGVRPESGAILYFAGIDEARFKRVVVPGDQLTLAVTLEKQKRNVWKFQTRALVGHEVAVEAGMTCVLKTPDAAQGQAQGHAQGGKAAEPA